MGIREDIRILTSEEISVLLDNFPGWEYKSDKITKEFSFEDFMDCLSFIVKLSSFCERNDHHPDIHIYYSKIVFELQRFDMGGKVTNMDFLVAEEIERLYKAKKE